MTTQSVHGTGIALGGVGVLLLGASGSGKSDVAYRLITERGAKLIADDQVVLRLDDPLIRASCKQGWEGQLELRGLGIAAVPHEQDVPIALVIDLVDRGEVPRLPEPLFVTVLGVRVPVLKLHAFDVSTPAKIAAAAEHWPHSGFPGADGRLG